MRSRKIAAVAALAAGAFALCGAPAVEAAAASKAAEAQSGAAAAFAQQTPPVRRARTQITINPRVSRPGPNAVRECTSWLEQQARPSGTVIVPQMRCWWRRP
jgi:hypothetical protein